MDKDEELAQPAQEPLAWVSVKDRLPNDGDLVLGFGQWEGDLTGLKEDFVIEYGDWEKGIIHIHGEYYGVDLVNVTHWMLSPKAPKD